MQRRNARFLPKNGSLGGADASQVRTSEQSQHPLYCVTLRNLVERTGRLRSQKGLCAGLAHVETDGYTCRTGQILAVSSSASGSSGSKDEMTESQTTLKRIEFNENIVALLGFAVLLISVVFLADRPPIRWAAIRFPND